MKRVLCFILTMTFCVNIGYATDLEELMPYLIEPCGYEDPTKWDGPKVLEICGDEFDEGYSTGSFECQECCYTIVYYDRWTSYYGGDDYEISIAGIFFDDYVNCGACLETMKLIFYRQILNQYNIDDTFYERFTDNRYRSLYNVCICRGILQGPNYRGNFAMRKRPRCCRRLMGVTFGEEWLY